MSTGTELIEDACSEIGAHSITQPMRPETALKAMARLNSMLALWRLDDIELGTVPIKTPGEEVGETLEARDAIIKNLALRVVPLFDRGKLKISPQLSKDAAKLYHEVKVLFQSPEIPDKVVSSTLPRGQGNQRYGYSHSKYFTPGETIDN